MTQPDTATDAGGRGVLWGVALGAAVISTSPVMVKAIDPDVLGPTAIAFHRVLGGAIFLFLWARTMGARLRLSRPVLLMCLVAGLCFAGDLYTWHRAIRLVGAGLSTLLANTQVVWVSLIGVFFLGERGGMRLVWQLVLAVLGVALLRGIFSAADAPTPDAFGFGLGLATGLFYTGFILALRRARTLDPEASPMALMAYASAATVPCLLLLCATGGESLIVSDLRTVLLLSGLAVLVQGIGWVLLSRNLSRVPAASGALLLLLQPTLATVWGILVFDEPFTVATLAGAALVLAAIYLGASRPVARAS